MFIITHGGILMMAFKNHCQIILASLVSQFRFLLSFFIQVENSHGSYCDT